MQQFIDKLVSFSVHPREERKREVFVSFARSFFAGPVDTVAQMTARLFGEPSIS